MAQLRRNYRRIGPAGLERGGVGKVLRTMSETERVFAGLKVLDVSTYIAGPAAATVLADFGADVIKVESPQGGDPVRRYSETPGVPQSDLDYCWTLCGRNKRSLAIDLKNDGAREALYRVVAQADVFVTNFPFPVRRRLGIRYEDLAALNPRLIYASLTAYGETGPEADRTGFDSTVWWARTGLMDLVRAGPDAPPARSLPAMGDHPTAMALYGAIVTGLYRRERTGKGGNVSSSLLANGVWSNAIYVQAMLAGAEVSVRPRREDAVNALTNLYETRDSRWFMMVLLDEGRYWPALADAIGRAHLCDDPRFATAHGRMDNPRDLTQELDAAFRERDWSEWEALLRQAGIPFGLVGQVGELANDAQARQSGVLVKREADDGGPAMTVNSPLWLADEVKVPAGPPPALGEHTDAVLREAGYDAAEIARLRQSGAFG